MHNQIQIAMHICKKFHVHKLTHKALPNEAFVVGMVDESKAWALL